MVTRRRSMIKPPQCYRLRVELADVKPLIWRTLWVEGQFTLVQLHHILQAAMGWSDAHLHQFDIGGRRYATPHAEDLIEPPPIDERTVRLGDLLSIGLRLDYNYDFGDGWRHHIVVEAAVPIKEPYGAARIEAGARACPPEDCGGPYGYQAFLDGLAKDPSNEEIVSFLQWAGEDFDPDRFDRHAANTALLRMAWNRWGER